MQDGFVQAAFIQGHNPGQGPLLFRLAGRAWGVLHVDWDRAIVHVRAAERGKVPTWLGRPSMLSLELCQQMRQVLTEPGPEVPWLALSAAAELDLLRQGYEDLLERDGAPLEVAPDQVQWHTFAGGAINRLLATALEHLTGEPWVAGNLSLKCLGLGAAQTHEAIHALPEQDWPALAIQTAHGLARGRVSKLQPCLPQEAEDRLLVDKLMDVDGTVAFLAGLHVPVVPTCDERS